MEKTGVPTVYLATSQFFNNAHLSAEDNGIPGMRIITTPEAGADTVKVREDPA